MARPLALSPAFAQSLKPRAQGLVSLALVSLALDKSAFDGCNSRVKQFATQPGTLPGGVAGLLGLVLLLNATPFRAQAANSETNAPVAPATGSTAVAAPLTNTAPISPYMEFLGQHLSCYEPIYFILGTYPAAEFQFSLKYKVFDFTNKVNPLTHLYFAYTQISFWDLLSSDPSFYDTSYKPSAFFLYHDRLNSGCFHLDLQPGFEHESNGRGGAGERSLYTAYLQPTATFDLPDHWQFSLQPRAWSYVDVGQNNPDIAEYRGYADLLSALTWTDPHSGEKIQFSGKVRMGDEGDHAGLQFDVRFNLAGVPVLRRFNPSIQVQYFTGYGQTLRQYDESSHGLRAGLCLWY
jgi:outer membrane phospholipase A